MAETTQCFEPGIYLRHRDGCPGTWHPKAAQSTCACVPNVQAKVWDNITKKRLPASFNKRSMGDIRDRVNAAKKWKAELEAKLGSGVLVVERNAYSLAELWELWYERAQNGSILTKHREPFRDSTLERWESSMRCHVLPAFGKMRADRISAGDVADFIATLEAAGLGPSSQQAALSPLRATYRWAIKREWLIANPVRDAEVAACPKKKIDPGTTEQAAKHIAAVRDCDRIMWALAAFAGLRRGECLGLRWSDLTLDGEPELRVRLQRTPPKMVPTELLKTDAGYRTVPLLDPLIAELRAHAERVARDELELRRMLNGISHAFVWEFVHVRVGPKQGTPCFPSWNRRLDFARADWRDAGLVGIATFHDTRHVFASHMIAAWVASGVNVDLQALATVMGHASAQQTEKYRHMIPGHQETLRQMMNDHWRQSTSG